MKPYYDDGNGIVLYHGDCRDVLPTLEPNSIDLVLTDPPYGMSWQSGRRQMRFEVLHGDDGNMQIHDIIGLALPALRNHRHIYVFGLDNFGKLPVTGATELVWDKGMMGLGNMSSPWGPAHEIVLFGVMARSAIGRERGDGRYAAKLRRGSVLRCDRLGGTQVKSHPTEKPVELLRQLIEASSLIGETVLDMFVGSGSTLLAAKLEGRKAIGVEIEERFCEVAANRLVQQVMVMDPTPRSGGALVERITRVFGWEDVR